MFLFYEKKKTLNMYFKSAVLCSEFQVQFFLPRRLMCIKLSEILIPFFFSAPSYGGYSRLCSTVLQRRSSQFGGVCTILANWALMRGIIA